MSNVNGRCFPRYELARGDRLVIIRSRNAFAREAG